MYWLAKEEIANTKFGSLLELLEQVGFKDLKFFQHRSASSVRETFLLLGTAGSTLQYASVYTSSRAVRTSELATEDPLKLEFLSSFRCKCLTFNVILLHNSSDYLTNTCWSTKTIKTCVFLRSSPRVKTSPRVIDQSNTRRWIYAVHFLYISPATF